MNKSLREIVEAIWNDPNNCFHNPFNPVMSKEEGLEAIRLLLLEKVVPEELVENRPDGLLRSPYAAGLKDGYSQARAKMIQNINREFGHE